VLRTVQEIVRQSDALRRLVDEQRLAVVGAILDNDSGWVEFLASSGVCGTLDTPIDHAADSEPRPSAARR
jgi:hypothetical protein